MPVKFFLRISSQKKRESTVYSTKPFVKQKLSPSLSFKSWTTRILWFVHQFSIFYYISLNLIFLPLFFFCFLEQNLMPLLIDQCYISQVKIFLHPMTLQSTTYLYIEQQRIHYPWSATFHKNNKLEPINSY